MKDVKQLRTGENVEPITNKLPKRVKTIETVIKSLVTDNVQLIEIIADQVKQNKEWEKQRYK